MAISDDEIAQVRAASDLVALISESVALKRSGQRWVGLCPFHAEKTPSFSVNAEEGRYYCFGCRVSGDQITWVREMMHLEFLDALRVLAERAGIELHDDAASEPARRERKAAQEAMGRAVAWYHERLLNHPDARATRDYLRSRGISGELARRFHLGWAPDEWDALSTSLALDESTLVATGLGFVNRRGRRQDALRARLIFPIFDPADKPIAVGGRVLPGRAQSGEYVEPKYKNSPETMLYAKRKTLYGLNFAKAEVIREGEIIVCEGYTDVIAFFAVGLERAVATCGTALGEDHFRLMRNFAKRIVLAYDADVAGQNAAAAVYQWERQHEVDVLVADLPRGSDPAELAQRDPDALRAAVSDAKPFLTFRLERVFAEANVSTAEGRARAGERAVDVLAEHPSELVRDQYVVNVADQLRLDLTTLRARVADVARRPRDQRPVAPSTSAPPPPPRRPVYRPGLEALRLYRYGPSDAKDRLVAAYFIDETQREVFEALASGATISELIDDFERRGDLDAAATLSELAVVAVERAYGPLEVAAVVAQLLRRAVGVELERLNRDLREGRVPPEVVAATTRDVKERLALLESPEGDGDVAEVDLRRWLLERAAAPTP